MMKSIFVFIILLNVNLMALKVAHRGASVEFPENTLSAFQGALNTDAGMIELDIHMTKDGHIVVFHDDELDRLTDGHGLISRKTLSELKSLTVLGREKIPTLKEALDLINGKIKLDIELKGVGVAKPVSDLIKQYVKNKVFTYADFIVTSFDHSQIIEFYQYLPLVEIGFIYDKGELPTHLMRLKEANVSWVVCDYRDININNLEKFHKNGFKVLVYTVNSETEYKDLKLLGVDAIATDKP
jgi:glycerophosphoryl diester phosphodiesterase